MTAASRPRHRHRRPPDTEAGAEGNEQLTALTGAVLLAGFALEGVTILALGRLLTLHVFLGVLLIGPVLLKIGSTGYRFARYYSGTLGYVRKGPPAPLLRVLGPLVVLTSLSVLGTGVGLLMSGPGHGLWLFAHKASFVLWFGVMTVHVLAYAWRLPRILLGRHGGQVPAVAMTGSGIRWLLLGGSLAAGLAAALLALHLLAAYPR